MNDYIHFNQKIIDIHPSTAQKYLLIWFMFIHSKEALKAALYGIFVGRWQHTFPKIGGNISSIDKTGSAYYRSPRKK